MANVKFPMAMMGVGMLCGVMMNVALGYPPWTIGGILGGFITGAAMWLLGGV